MEQMSLQQRWDELRAIATNWMEIIWQQRQIDAVDELHAPSFIDYSAAGRSLDNAGYKAGIAELYKAFPDWEAFTNDLVIDPIIGKVAIRWTATGTHSASFMNVPATDKCITFTGIEILTIQEGRIVERWGEWDAIAILQQLNSRD